MPGKPKPPEERYPLKLTELQRDALLAAIELTQDIRDRFREAPPGTKPVMLTEAELEEIIDAAYHAKGDMTAKVRRSLVAIVDKIDDIQADIHFKTIEEKRRKLPRKAKIYQFKVTLIGVKPPIWRRFQIPDSTLGELHFVLQTVMGWTDTHLHSFRTKGKIYGDPLQNDFGIDTNIGDEETILISQIRGLKPKSGLLYEYDFGDGWEHAVVLEKVLDPEKGVTYPRCLKGARACPPEDCGGIWSYNDILAAAADPRHYRHAEVKEWLMNDFDPEAFSVAQINELLRPT